MFVNLLHVYLFGFVSDAVFTPLHVEGKSNKLITTLIATANFQVPRNLSLPLSLSLSLPLSLWCVWEVGRGGGEWSHPVLDLPYMRTKNRMSIKAKTSFGLIACEGQNKCEK